jgi:two-component system LytT family response regulator
MKQSITCLVVDDDEIDRLTTVSHLKDYPFITIAGVFDDPLKALTAAAEKKPDVLFLDIDMPGMSGLELRKKLLHVPACVFITSYPDYAVDGFEMAALDFLVKPIHADRFAKMIDRLQQHVAIRQKAALLEHTLGGDTIFIKDGHEQVKLQLHEILYLEALKDYTGIVTTQKKYAVLSPLSTLIREKGFDRFIRIHRSYAVQRNYIRKLSSNEVLINDIPLPVGRTYKDQLKGIIPGL